MDKFLDIKNIDFEEVITKGEIISKVQIIAKDMSELFKNDIPIIICVLKGAFFFMCDLVRNLDIECEIDFISIGSYANETISSGKVTLNQDIKSSIEGRHVVIVEDIIDSGLTVRFLKKHFSAYNPKTLRFATLLYKSKKVSLDFKIDWIGFNIDDGFFVGYGLDHMQLLRCMENIKKINKG